MGLIPVPEKRFMSLSSLDKFINMFYGVDGQPSYTGKMVSEDNAMGVAAVYACVSIISNYIGMIPANVIETTGSGLKNKNKKHSVYTLMRHRPNPAMNAMTFRETVQANTLLTGDGCAEIERDKSGRVIAMWPIPTRYMRDIFYSPTVGDMVYVVEIPGMQKRIVLGENMIHIKSLGNGFRGLSPISLHREALALSMAADEFGARFYSNGAMPKVVITMEKRAEEEDRESLRESWAKLNRGLSNAHRAAVLDQGMQVNKIGVDPHDAQFIETRKYQVVEIARIFNVKLHKIQALDNATYSNIEQQNREFLDDTLMPWETKWEQEANYKLFTADERETHEIKFNNSMLLRGDVEARTKLYRQFWEIGAYSANDVLRFEDENPVEHGDKRYRPLNFISTSVSDDDIDSGEDDTENDDRSNGNRVASGVTEVRTSKARNRLRGQFIDLFRDAANAILAKEGNAVKRKAERYLSKGDVQGFIDWTEEFYHDNIIRDIERIIGPVMTSYMRAVLQDGKDEISDTSDDDTANEVLISSYISNYADRHAGSSAGQLREIVRATDVDEDGKIVDKYNDKVAAVVQRVDEWRGDADTDVTPRADRIASNEVVRAEGAVLHALYMAAGFSAIWTIQGAETCPYCRTLNGKRIYSGGSFAAYGDEIKPDGVDGVMRIRHTHKHPPLHMGCDCYLKPGI